MKGKGLEACVARTEDELRERVRALLSREQLSRQREGPRANAPRPLAAP